MSTAVATPRVYTAPRVSEELDVAVETNDVPIFVAAVGWVALVFGSAWAYCQAMCGWRNVRRCSAGWLKVTAVCKR